MKLYLRIFIAYFLLLGLSGYYLYSLSVNEIKPAMRQSSEEILVDTANLLAEIIGPEFKAKDFEQSLFVREVENFLDRSISANIFSIDKSRSNLRIYITDHKGIVRYHSGLDYRGQIGKDYSQWNDVYLTLRGKYGARSTEDITGNPMSTVMYVAAPILDDEKIIGVLTVGKPGVDIQPFIDRSINKLKKNGLIILIISVVLGVFLSYWLTRSIRELTNYAKAVSNGQTVSLPPVYDTELQLLGESMEAMRSELEGKNYVEQYAYSLTHELKSPISAIKGASELLSQEMDSQDFQKLKNNIRQESSRLNDFVTRLLDLVRVEKIEILENLDQISLKELIGDVIESKRLQLNNRSVQLEQDVDDVNCMGDNFLLKQCLDNLIQNALDFSFDGSTIAVTCKVKGTTIEITVSDEGEGIPEYAIERIFERFYSLSRPNSGLKSSGIGLSFVKQAVQLHQGRIFVSNRSPSGVIATIILPKA
ncbi:MAG: two-component system sensor histidine kinase CreC [Cellvibrionaceae bacterium]